jgi:hypothetical protein
MRKIVAESASLEGGVAAVLLQIAHPAVVAGVAAHSSFTYRRIERARRSVVYIYCMTFGTSEEKRLITDATHCAHAQVKGKGYDANDVDAQLWVAATIYWSMVESYEMVFGKLEEERAERVYREFSVMATALRVPPEKWPKDTEAFRIYWDEVVSNLVITDEAMEREGTSWQHLELTNSRECVRYQRKAPAVLKGLNLVLFRATIFRSLVSALAIRSLFSCCHLGDGSPRIASFTRPCKERAAVDQRWRHNPLETFDTDVASAYAARIRIQANLHAVLHAIRSQTVHGGLILQTYEEAKFASSGLMTSLPDTKHECVPLLGRCDTHQSNNVLERNYTVQTRLAYRPASMAPPRPTGSAVALERLHAAPVERSIA